MAAAPNLESRMDRIEAIRPWQVGPDYPRWTEQLRDGSRVLIRPIRRQDAAAQKAFVAALSSPAPRYRFFGNTGHKSTELIERAALLDYRHEFALAAVVHDDARDAFVGVSRYSTTSDGVGCECAVSVADAWQNKGLGAILMKHLIDVAGCRGVHYMWSAASAENLAMADLARFLGFDHEVDPDDPSRVVYMLWLRPAERPAVTPSDPTRPRS